MNHLDGLYTFINFLHDDRFEINYLKSNQCNEVVAILEIERPIIEEEIG